MTHARYDGRRRNAHRMLRTLQRGNELEERETMLQISQQQLAMLKARFLPDRPGPLIGLHVLQTGHGVCFVDRWPDPAPF